jgi:S-DNA-T family DNA segregation ATPase FtsK/SpoIIIE
MAVSRDQAVGRESREARETVVREIEEGRETHATADRNGGAAGSRAEQARRKEKQVQLFARPPSRDLPELAPRRTARAGSTYSPEALDAISRLVEIKLKDFGIDVEVVAVQPGPVVTRFELKPALASRSARSACVRRTSRARSRPSASASSR